MWIIIPVAGELSRLARVRVCTRRTTHADGDGTMRQSRGVITRPLISDTHAETSAEACAQRDAGRRRPRPSALTATERVAIHAAVDALPPMTDEQIDAIAEVIIAARERRRHTRQTSRGPPLPSDADTRSLASDPPKRCAGQPLLNATNEGLARGSRVPHSFVSSLLPETMMILTVTPGVEGWAKRADVRVRAVPPSLPGGRRRGREPSRPRRTTSAPTTPKMRKPSA
jgi:hypothetical protein